MRTYTVWAERSDGTYYLYGRGLSQKDAEEFIYRLLREQGLQAVMWPD